jgi:hypothetical protein
MRIRDDSLRLLNKVLIDAVIHFLRLNCKRLSQSRLQQTAHCRGSDDRHRDAGEYVSNQSTAIKHNHIFTPQFFRSRRMKRKDLCVAIIDVYDAKTYPL